MNVALRIAAAALGLFLIGWAVGSAVKTVILPRAAASYLVRGSFVLVRKVFSTIVPRSASFERKDRILALYTPLSLLVTLGAWLVFTLLGFMCVFRAVEDSGWRDAFDLAGSSLLTLGISRPDTLLGTALAFTDAAIGLMLLALLITYLPTIYGAFQRRENLVTALEVRAGSPPSGVELLERYWLLERMDALEEVWVEWERWFTDVEETHTSLPALVFLRSPEPDHSWVTSAGAVLDGASLLTGAVDTLREVRAEICIRAGYLCLHRITDFFGIPHDPKPKPDDPIHVSREEFDAACARLSAAGVPIKADRDQAWRDFAGWRVNYDSTLLALANLTTAPVAPWSSDRSGERTMVPRLFRRIAPTRDHH